MIDFGIFYFNCSVGNFLEHLSDYQNPSISIFHQPSSSHNLKACAPSLVSEKKETVNESKIIILEPRLLTEISLLKYLEKRNIPFSIAEKFCKEIDFLLYGKTRTVIGFQNNAGGYELRSPHFKGSSSPKEVTFFNHNKEELKVFEGFFKEILDEQQKANNIYADNIAAINQLAINVNSLNDRLANLKIIPPPFSTKPYEEIIKKGITDMQLTVGNQSKTITRKFQIFLFPEQDAKLFYRIVFGRWFLWLVVMLFITNLYKWSVHNSDNHKEIKLQQLETDRIKKAWNYLYFQEGKTIRRVMDSAYSKSKLSK
jgi:hypothetical protein